MKIGFIGAGKMAEAMIASLLKAGAAAPADIAASDVSEERRRAVAERYGVGVSADNAGVVAGAEIVVLAVKPQNLAEVLAQIAPAVTPKHLVISIAAGKKIAGIEALIPGARVIRVMPNVACLIGEGMSAFAAGSRATAEDRRTAAALLASFGQAVELPEEQFDAVTALSGSGPAFFAYVLDRLAEAAVAEGLDRESAARLAAQTMLGTARLLMEKRLPPRELIAMVASPKGTTVAGLGVLDASPIGQILRDTISAAAKRSRELSG